MSTLKWLGWEETNEIDRIIVHYLFLISFIPSSHYFKLFLPQEYKQKVGRKIEIATEIKQGNL